jgi:hypothetical protein
MAPDLSHLVVCGPDWFCTRDTLEIFRSWSTLVCLVNLCSCLACFLAMGSSLLSMCVQVGFDCEELPGDLYADAEGGVFGLEGRD